MKRAGVLILIAAAVMHASAIEQKALKVDVDLVNVLFTVTDHKGHLVSGLGRDDFLIEEDGRKQDIHFFSRDNETPLTLGILVDTSPSVRDIFNDECAAADRFLDKVLRPKDLAMVIGFEKHITLVQDFTDQPRRLQRAIDSLEPGPLMGGGTSLYDALYLAAREKLHEEAGRKAIILISDGKDTTSKVHIDEAMIAVHGSDAVIYSVAIAADWHDPRAKRIPGDPGALKHLSEETGGTFFHIDEQRELDQAFAKINEELRNQYSLAYVSLNTEKDGSYRRIRIIPRDPSFKIQARKGYYAPKPPAFE